MQQTFISRKLSRVLGRIYCKGQGAGLLSDLKGRPWVSVVWSSGHCSSHRSSVQSTCAL